jgi:hypothetical protein
MAPNPPDPLVALELRWFLRGGLTEAVEHWFRKALDAPESERDARLDVYLSLTGESMASIKLRQGKLEIKYCESASPLEAHGFAGQAQRWIKWTGRLDTAVAEAEGGRTPAGSAWIAVDKERWQKKYEWRERAFTPVTPGDTVAGGVAIEIGRVSVAGQMLGTVLIEAFAPEPGLERLVLLAALEKLCGGYPEPRPAREDSYGYPQLLASSMSVDPATRASRLTAMVALDYDYLTQQLLKNEEMGEKRVGLFLTLTAGIGATAMLAREKLSGGISGGLREVFLAVNVVWLLLGYVTLRRILRRNRQTDELKAQLGVLRGHYVKYADLEGRRTLPYDPYDVPKADRAIRLWRGKGGYAEMVALLNAVAAGALVWQVVHLVVDGTALITGVTTSPLVNAILATVGALVTAFWAWRWQLKESAAE